MTFLIQSSLQCCNIFQSTHLIRGVTVLGAIKGSTEDGFQSTHLIRGVTSLTPAQYPHQCHFNPHTSYEVWRLHFISHSHNLNFNPHTSYEVWRRPPTLLMPIKQNFNPHTSYEVWLVVSSLSSSMFSIFQSTHLIRGVTSWVSLYQSHLWNFNPHTSYEVWPDWIKVSLTAFGYFNPHTSYEVWLAVFKLFKSTLVYFNPHTSYEVWHSHSKQTAEYR